MIGSFAELGVLSDLATSHAKKITNANILSLIFFVVGCVYSVIYAFQHIVVISLISLVSGSSFSLVLLLNKIKKYNISRLFLVFSLNIIVFVFYKLLGASSGFHYWFFLSAQIPFIIFEFGELRLVVFSLVWTGLLIGLAWFGDFSFILPLMDSVTENYAKTFSLLNFLVVFAILSLFTYYMILDEKNLTVHTQELQTKFKKQMAALEASAIIVFTDPAGKILHVNDEFCKVSGYTKEELIGSPHSIVNSGYHSKEFFEDLWSTISSKKIWRGEICNRSKDGRNYWVYTTIVPMLGENGQIEQYAAIRHEITEKKMKEGKFYSLFHQEGVAICFINLKGEIIEANKKYGDLYGYSAKDLSGKKIFDLTHPDDLVKSSEFVNKIKLGQAGFFVFERRILKPDGSIVWNLVNLALIRDASGKPDYLTAVLQDITQSKELQQKLIQSAKMSSLGEMAGGIAHEINNPLGIIHGKASQILKMVKSGVFSHDAIVEQLGKIVSTSDRIAKIIRGLKSFSRNGEQDPFELESVESLMGSVLDLCSERFKNKSVDLQIGSLPKIGIECRGVQLSQVILNLLNNAHDAVMLLPEKWVRVDIKVLESQVQFSVTDSGHGIPDAIAEKLMQPFFTTKEVGKGTGLGLSISKGIVEDHGGKFWLDRTSVHTKFIIELPIRQNKVFKKTA